MGGEDNIGVLPCSHTQCNARPRPALLLAAGNISSVCMIPKQAGHAAAPMQVARGQWYLHQMLARHATERYSGPIQTLCPTVPDGGLGCRDGTYCGAGSRSAAKWAPTTTQAAWGCPACCASRASGSFRSDFRPPLPLCQPCCTAGQQQHGCFQGCSACKSSAASAGWPFSCAWSQPERAPDRTPQCSIASMHGSLRQGCSMLSLSAL